MGHRKRLILPLAVLLILAALLALFLRNLGSRYPERAADGAPWDRSWTMLGTVLGAEDPGNGFALLENNTILTAEDIYYASWAAGEPEPYVNSEGNETDLYPAQIYLLLQGCADGENAQKAVQAWLAREEDSYSVRETRSGSYNGQDYTLLLYDCGSDTNPYSRGISAFGVYGRYAVSAELTCREDFSGDEAAVLAEFLDGCHYGAGID